MSVASTGTSREHTATSNGIATRVPSAAACAVFQDSCPPGVGRDTHACHQQHDAWYGQADRGPGKRPYNRAPGLISTRGKALGQADGRMTVLQVAG